MANARFIFVNEWDAAALSLQSGNQSAGLPLVNTQRYNNSRVYRSLTTVDQVIQFDLAEPTYLSGLSLWRHNLTSAAVLKLELFDGPNCTGIQSYDSGFVPAVEPKTLGDLDWGLEPLGASTFTAWELSYSVLWFPLTATKSGRLTISDPTNSAGFLEVCRVYLGRAFEPEVNVDLGHSLQWETTTESARTAGGTVHTLETATFRSLRFNLSHIQPTERGAFFDYTRRVSTHRDFFVSLRPEQGGSAERDYSFAAKFAEIPPLTAEPARYAAPCTLKEA